MASAPTFIGSGAQGISATGLVNVAWTTGHVAGNFALFVLESSGADTAHDITNPTGVWNHITGSPLVDVATTAGSIFSVFHKFAESSAEVTPDVGDNGDHQLGKIFTFGGVNPNNPFNVETVSSTKTTASTTVTFPSITTTKDNCLIVLIASRPNDGNSTTFFSGYTNSNLTGLAEAGEAGGLLANGGGFAVAYGIKEVAGSTGTTTATLSSSITNCIFTIALEPIDNFRPSAIIF